MLDNQKTLKKEYTFEGKGLHSGIKVKMRISRRASAVSSYRPRGGQCKGDGQCSGDPDTGRKRSPVR